MYIDQVKSNQNSNFVFNYKSLPISILYGISTKYAFKLSLWVYWGIIRIHVGSIVVVFMGIPPQ